MKLRRKFLRMLDLRIQQSIVSSQLASSYRLPRLHSLDELVELNANAETDSNLEAEPRS